MTTPTKSPAILAARTLLTGDVSLARSIMRDRARAMGCSAVEVCEARALIGATAEANRRFGCALSWSEIAFGVSR